MGDDQRLQKKYIDSHCHLADPRLATEVEAMIARAESRSITQFLQGGVGPEDWQRQKDLQKKFSGIRLCFGLHPYWIMDHDQSACESALNDLSRCLHEAEAIGEVGLDFRPQFDPLTWDRQLEFFHEQLELAEVAQKPVVFHLVKAQPEVQKYFMLHPAPSCGGMVHAFTGSTEQAQFYLELGLHLSVGGPVVREKNDKLRKAVAMIPLEKLLLESDSPDQPPPRLQGVYNEPESLWDVAHAIGEIRKLSAEEILDISSRNLEKLLAHGKHQSALQS